MVCVHCGAKTHIINSRAQHRLNQVWRRRQCFACHAIFTTGEMVTYEATWAVRNAQGTLQPFLRDKLLLSLYKSCEHRPAALKEAGALAETVISKLRPFIYEAAIDSHVIVQTAQVALSRFDHAASVHYAAFHA